MKKTLFIVSLFVAAIASSAAFAQEVPADIKAKIAETAASKKIPESKRAAWVEKQSESWLVVSAIQFDLPKKDVDKLKADAQSKFPYHYSKQESYIMAQGEALQEINQIKSVFEKDEFQKLFDHYYKTCNGNYRKICDKLYADSETKAQIAELTIEGMDKTMVDILKKGLTAQYPTDLKAQLKALKKQAEIMAVAQRAKETEAVQKSEEPQEISRSELTRKAEETFKKSTVIIAGKNKTGTGVFVKTKDKIAMLFPPEFYNEKGRISVSTVSGEEGTVSLAKTYSAKNVPLMMTLMDEAPLGLTPLEFGSNEELKSSIGKQAVIVGFYGEAIRPVAMMVAQIVKENVKMVSPIVYTYNQGTLILNAKTFRPMAICIASEKEYPNFDFTSNRLANMYERYLERAPRYLTAIRLDIPVNWELVKENKMNAQLQALAQISDINEALMMLVSGSFEDASKNKVASPICEKYTAVLDKRIGAQALKMEYRSFITALINVLRRPLESSVTKDCYANLRSELKFHMRLANELNDEFKKELKNNSHTLAPKEFDAKFTK